MKTTGSKLWRDTLFVIRLLIGFILIIVGLIGLLFPIFPDWILIIVGIFFFDFNGHIAKSIFRLLPKRARNKATDFSLKTEEKIDRIFGSGGGD